MPIPRHRRVRGHNPWGNHRRADLRLEVPDWTRDALCAEVGVEMFFPSRDTAWLDAPAAKQICARCPVRAECLEWALTFASDKDQDGVFGGTSPRERHRLRQQLQEVAA